MNSEALEGSGTAVKVGKDFVGYEIAYYSIKAAPTGGVSIRFSSAEAVRSGQPAKESQPLLPLFNLRSRFTYVRLLFFARVTRADHNQGILAAASPQSLNELTQSVEANPDENCRTYGNFSCLWVPAGVAAQPEKRDPANPKEWIPTW